MGALKTNSEFCDDLLSACTRRKLAHAGYPPIRAEYGNDGTIRVTFGGFNSQMAWIEKRVTFRAILPVNPVSDEIAALASPEGMAEACGQIISDIEAKQNAGLIRKSSFGDMARA